MKRQKEISAAVGEGANLIQSKIPIGANITVSTPLKDQLKSAWMIGVFMNSNMGAIVVFLTILSIKLIYSLLISNVEEKTYEFGMLRALGFTTKNVVVTISM